MPNQEIIKYTLNLLKTMEEGMDYVKAKLGEFNIEGTVMVLTDLITAFTEVEKSISPMIEKLSKNNIMEKSDKLRRAFDTMVREFETTKGQKAYEIMQFTLEPTFKNWKEDLESILKPYVLS
jgi:hypothetical protein